MKNTLFSPQVFAAVITSTVAIILALLPTLTNNSAPPPPVPTVTNTAIIEVIAESPTVGITSQPTDTEAPVIIPTSSHTPISAPTNTIVPPTAVPPTNTPMPTPTHTLVPATDAPPPNILLLYDGVSFTLYNQSSGSLSINNLGFRSANGNWEGNGWGPSLASNVPANNCLRMRDTTSGQRQPPPICGTLLGLQLVGGSALFWLNVDAFEVVQDGSVIAICSTASDNCPIYVSQQ